MTRRLPALLASTSRYHKCVTALTDIFRGLESGLKGRISVNLLQKDGPAEFARSEEQEDAQQYLLALMGTLE